MKTVREIFEAVGGVNAVAAILNVKPKTAKEMRRRGVIPAWYWVTIFEWCKTNGVRGLSYKGLAEMHSRLTPPV
jgi:hypothetical protein